MSMMVYASLICLMWLYTFSFYEMSDYPFIPIQKEQDRYLIAQPHNPPRRTNRDEATGNKPLDTSSLGRRRDIDLNVLI